VAALLAAKHAIEHEGRQAVAIVAGDTVGSARLQEFLTRADSSCSAAATNSSNNRDRVPTPVIPNLYDRVARWHMQQYGTTREQLVSLSCLCTDSLLLCAEHFLCLFATSC
jgi:acetyl-CoA acetyltransferase